jgi:hypothetical protein
MRYLMLIHVDEEAAAAEASPDQPAVSAPYLAYAQAMTDAGVRLGGARLRPSSSATTVRVRDGQTQVLDGPYAEAKEQLGGFFMIEAESLDDAVAWAARCPGAATGALEVRPVWA